MRSGAFFSGPCAILILFIATMIQGRLGSPLSLVTLGLMLQRVHTGLAIFLVFLVFLGDLETLVNSGLLSLRPI